MFSSPGASISPDNLNWLGNLEEAQRIAQEREQSILLVFSGSDWCRPCMKLDKELFSTSAFETYAQEHFVLVKADFPRSKKHRLPKEQQSYNAQLADQYNPGGNFPFLLVLSQAGEVIDQTGYLNDDPDSYFQHWSSISDSLSP